MKIYTAGPMSGLTIVEMKSKFLSSKIRLEDMGYQVLAPLCAKNLGTGIVQPKGYVDHISNDKAIFLRDRWMVDQADVIFADFTLGKDRTSIGTCFEMAWAFSLNKHIVTVLPEDNAHHHAFIYQSSHVIFETTEEAYEYLRELGRGL